MTINRITLQNWRSITSLETHLVPGVNVVLGPNESGKSSLVEALDWALFRDLAGTRLSAEEIRSIIPVGAPEARPEVALELEFSDCSAVISKTLAEDAAKRSVGLVIRRPNEPDEHFFRTDAQRRLRELCAADGYLAADSPFPDANVLISHQGEALDYMVEGGGSLRSTLRVTSDGNVALTSRLEKVRLKVEASRKKELMQDLGSSNVIGGPLTAARAGSDAASCRDNLAALEEKLAHLKRVEAAVQSIREEIQQHQGTLTPLVQRQQQTREQLETLNQNLLAQGEADRKVNEAEKVVTQLEGQRKDLNRRLQEVANLRAKQAEEQALLQFVEARLLPLTKELHAARAQQDEAQAQVDRAEHAAASSRTLQDAWTAYAHVFDCREQYRKEQQNLASLEQQHQMVEEAGAAWKALPVTPTVEECETLRLTDARWKELTREAQASLQLDLHAEASLEVHVTQDQGPPTFQSLASQSVARVNAQENVQIYVPGLLRIRVRNGARGVAEIREETDRALADLEARLAPWEISLPKLGNSLEQWKQANEERHKCAARLLNCKTALERDENRFGPRTQLESRLHILQQELREAKLACEPFSGLITFGGKNREEVRLELKLAATDAKAAASVITQLRNELIVRGQSVKLLEQEWHQLSLRPQALNDSIAERRDSLHLLEPEAGETSEGAAALEALSAQLWEARQNLETISATRAQLGNAVNKWMLADAQQEHTSALKGLTECQKRLAELQRDLTHHCQEDVSSQQDKLEFEISTARGQAEHHENRLGGLTILDALLQLESSRVGLVLGQLLNGSISPWLSQLRGKKTSLVFDEAGGRIESVLTAMGPSIHQLAFADHSEGMKEQVAFALRLLLAQRSARQLPSGRLPIILDDPFTQSDKERRTGLETVLNEAAANLQILFVTCHPEHAPQAGGERLLKLGQWSAGELLTNPVARARSGKKAKTSGTGKAEPIAAPNLFSP